MPTTRPTRAGTLLVATILVVGGVAALFAAGAGLDVAAPTDTAVPVDGGDAALDGAADGGQFDQQRAGTVATPSSAQQAPTAFEIAELDSANETPVGENVTVTATVTSDVNASATGNATLTVDGNDSVVWNETKPVESPQPTENEFVPFHVDTGDLGAGEYDYTVDIGNATADGTLIVLATGSIDVGVGADVVDPADNATVTVDVTDGNDTAVANEAVELSAARPNATVAVDDLAPDTYTVVATASDYNETTTPVTVVSNQTAETNLVLQRHTGSVSGTVLDADAGGGVENASVHLDYWDASDGAENSTVTNESGGYQFAEVPVGEHVVRVNASGYENGTRNVSVLADQPADGDVDLTPRGDPDFNVTALDLAMERVSGDATVTANATVANDGPVTGSQTVEIAVASASSAATPNSTRSVELGPSNSSELSFDIDTAPLDAGEHSVEVVTENDARNATLTVARNATIEGSVELGVADPDVAVTVELRVNGTDDEANGTLASTDVTIDGTATSESFAVTVADLVQQRNASVNATASNYESSATDVSFTPGETTSDADLALDRLTGSVEVTATDASTNGSVNATVQLWYFGNAANASVSEPLSLGTDGTETFGDVPVGNHSLTVAADDYRNATAPVNVTDGGTVAANLSLARETGSVNGTVENEDGGPTPNATVELLPTDEATGDSLENATDASGAFRFDGVPVGAYDLNVSAGGYQSANESVTVEANQTASEDVDLVALGAPDLQILQLQASNETVDVGGNVTLNATVVNDGTANGTATLTLNVTNADGVLVDHASTGVNVTPNGTASLGLELNTSGLDAGEYEYAAGIANETKNGTITVRAEGNLTAAVSLDVVDPASSTSVAVDVQDGNGTVVANGTVELSAGSTNGTATFENVTAGNYTVVATADDYVANDTDVEVLANDGVTTTLSLARETGSVEGTVTNSDGDALSNAPVELVTFDEGASGITENATDAGGAFRFDDVPVGEHRLDVSVDGYRDQNQTVDVSANATATPGIELSPENEPHFEPVSISLSDATVAVGSNVTVDAVVENTGTVGDTQTVNLTVRGPTPGVVHTANETVDLDGTESDTLSFEIDTTGLDGEHTVEVATEDENATTNLAVVTTGTVTGTVGADVVDPAANVTVDISANGTNASTTVELGDSGPVQYDLDAVDVGEGRAVNVTANATNYSANETTVTVDPNAITSANFTLERDTGSVDGTVLENGSAIEDATVELLAFGNASIEPLANTTTETDGSFLLEDVPVGEHALAVTVDGNQTNESVTVEADKSVEQNVTLGDESDGDDGEEDDSDDDDDDSGGGLPPIGPSPDPQPDPAPAPQPDPEPDLRLTDVDPLDVSATVGETVDVTARVVNEGDAAGQATVELRVGEETVGSESVIVEVNESVTTEFTIETADVEPDVYRTEVAAAGEEVAGALYVTQPEVDGSDNGFVDAENGTGPGDGQPGFGVPAALAALAVVTCLGWRRHGTA